MMQLKRRANAMFSSPTGKLMLMLFNQGRTEDANRAATDPDYRQKLYQEFQIA